jgi:hypothetical protein
METYRKLLRLFLFFSFVFRSRSSLRSILLLACPILLLPVLVAMSIRRLICWIRSSASWHRFNSKSRRSDCKESWSEQNDR